MAPPWFGSPLGDFPQLWLRAPSPLVLWSPGPLVLWSPGPGPLVPWSSDLSILWSSVAAFGRFQILPVTAFGASDKTGPLQSTIFLVFKMLRLLRSQETANTVFAVLERLSML